MELEFEKRKFTNGGAETEYSVLVMDSAEKWLEAPEFKSRFELDLGQKKLNFPLRGISFLEWEQQEELFPMPDQLQPKNIGEKISQAELDEWQSKVDTIRQRRKVFMLQNVVGMSIPGNDMEEKVTWLNSRSYDAVESFHNYLEMHMTGITDSPLLDQFNSESSLAESKLEITQASSFDDWDTADKTHTIFRFSRYFDTYVTEFHLRRVPHEIKARIEKETKAPDPPNKVGRNPTTGKIDPAYFEPNLNDPRWKQQCRAMDHKKTVMVLEACLPFQIPGDDYKQKHIWISKRLVGDVLKLQNHITNDLLGYQRQFDFFTSPSDRPSLKTGSPEKAKTAPAHSPIAIST